MRSRSRSYSFWRANAAGLNSRGRDLGASSTDASLSCLIFDTSAPDEYERVPRSSDGQYICASIECQPMKNCFDREESADPLQFNRVNMRLTRDRLARCIVDAENGANRGRRCACALPSSVP